MPEAEKPIAERRRALIAGLLFSVFMTLMFPPFGLWGFAFVSISPLVWCAASTKKPLQAGLFAGLGSAPFWAFEHRWLVDVTLAGYPALVFYLSLYPALFVWIAARLRLRGGFWAGLTVWFFATVVIWVGLEVFRSRVMFHGYPWFRICFPLTLIGSMSWFTGISGASFYAATISSLIGIRFSRSYRDFFRPQWIPGTFKRTSKADGMGITTLLVVSGLPLLSIFSEPRWSAFQDHARIGILQTNVPQSNKIAWSYEQKLADFDRFVKLTREAGLADNDWPLGLIVWPETMFPGMALDPDAVAIERDAHLRFPDGTPTTYFFDQLMALQREIDIPMLIGAIGIDGLRIDIETDGSVSIDQDALYNSVFLISNGVVSEQRYDKLHLTPFGEVMPYISASDWLEERLLSFGAQGMSFALSAGDEELVFEIPDLVSDAKTGERRPGRVVTPICFEGTMPNVVRRLVFDEHGDRKADFIIQLSNDGWFGDTVGSREQHLQLMRWIAVETRTSVVRAVNTGISTTISSSGSGPVASPNGFAAETSYGEPWEEGIVLVGAAVLNHPPPPIYLGNFIDWTTLVFTALAVIVPMAPVGSRSVRSGDGACDSDIEGPADAHADPPDSPPAPDAPAPEKPDPGGSA